MSVLDWFVAPPVESTAPPGQRRDVAHLDPDETVVAGRDGVCLEPDVEIEGETAGMWFGKDADAGTLTVEEVITAVRALEDGRELRFYVDGRAVTTATGISAAPLYGYALGYDMPGHNDLTIGAYDGVHLGPEVPVPDDVLAGPRVGVSRAADVPWRFWLAGEPSVSTYRRNPRAAS